MSRSLALAAVLLAPLVAAPGCCTVLAHDQLQQQRHELRCRALERIGRASVAAGPGLTLHVVKRDAQGREAVLAASLDGPDREGHPRALVPARATTLPPSSVPVVLTKNAPGTFAGRSGSWWRSFVVTSDEGLLLERPRTAGTGDGVSPELVRRMLAESVLVSVEVPDEGDEWLLRVSVPPPGGRRLLETPEGPVPADVEASLCRLGGPTGARSWGPTFEFVALLPLAVTVDAAIVALSPVVVPLVLLDEGARKAGVIEPRGHCMP